MAKEALGYVLVVDDITMMRRLISGIVRQEGYRAEEAASAEEALEAIQAQVPSLIFLDLSLPEMSGLEALNWIRANEASKETPVVICSANKERPTVLKAIDAGANDYLCKPVSRDGVKKRLGQFMAPPKKDEEPA
jgi:two-component system, chemotaxis family, chemotaxis protein CheY